MNYKQLKTFDLSIRRPKVLLFGNGLTRETSVSWQELIRSMRRDGANVERYERYEDGKFQSFLLPNTVMTLATSIIEDKQRHETYTKVLNKRFYPENAHLKALLSLPFDAVLTTNYTYEAEAVFRPDYPGLANRTKGNYAATTGDKRDPKYLIHGYNHLENTSPDIWHIHGELRCPSSVILSHDEYARLVHELIEHNRKRGNDYVTHKTDLRFTSWMDYFLMGDVYILGFGMDFSEFDLWWLLGRRQREKAECGTCVFYEPDKPENRVKQSALTDSGVVVKTLGVEIHSSADYATFYKLAIADITKQVH